MIGDGIAKYVVGLADGHRARQTARRSRARPPRYLMKRARASTCASRPGSTRKDAQSKPIEHLEAVAPWHVQLEFEREADGRPFKGATEGPGFDAISGAMHDAYGRDDA